MNTTASDELLQRDTDWSEDLQDLVLENEEIGDFLSNLAQFTASHVGSVDEVHCGIMLDRRKRATAVASSDDLALRMDEIQAGFDEGPCLHSMRTKSTVLVRDTRTDERWPDYLKAVVDREMHSILAVPVVLEGNAAAAINLYAAAPDAFGPSDIELAQQFAAQAGKALRIAVRTTTHAETAEHRRMAMESRTPIDIAVGIIMAQNRCGQDEAIEILRRACANRNVRLRDLAQDLIAGIAADKVATAFEE